MIRNLKEAVEVLERHLDLAEEPLKEAVEWIVALMRSRWGEADKARTCSECGFACLDSYMLTDETWRTILPIGRGILHLECAEKRLGRALIPRDFKDIPMNHAALYFLRKLSHKGERSEV